MTKNELLKEQVLRSSGVNPLKCMRCGKCSATCPAYDEMPQQAIVSALRKYAK